MNQKCLCCSKCIDGEESYCEQDRQKSEQSNSRKHYHFIVRIIDHTLIVTYEPLQLWDEFSNISEMSGLNDLLKLIRRW